jgi:uncharacterized RDD family membrane protein YckC
LSPTPAIDPFSPPSASLETELPAGEQPLARRFARLAAVILDAMVALPFLFMAFVATPVFFGLNFGELLKRSPLQFMLVAFAFSAPIWLYQCYLIATTGQSLGKRWMKLKIVRVDGGAVDFVSGVALRSWALGGFGVLVNLLGVGGLYSFVHLVDIVLIFGSSRRMLHDLIAGTKVVALAPSAADS